MVYFKYVMSPKITVAGIKELKRDPFMGAKNIFWYELLSDDKQERLSNASIDELFDCIMNRDTLYPLCIYPQYASPAMRALEAEVVVSLNSFREVYEKNLSRLRKQLGNRKNLIELMEVENEIYTQAKRGGKNQLQASGQIEFKTTRANPFIKTMFLVTHSVVESAGLLYYLEEITKIAPESAKAYLRGQAWRVDVEDKKVESPIVAETTLGPINQRNGEYRVVPIRFFKDVEIDRSKKYDTELKKNQRGPIASYRPIAVPRK